MVQVLSHQRLGLQRVLNCIVIFWYHGSWFSNYWYNYYMLWRIILLHQTNSNLSGPIIELCSNEILINSLPWINPFYIPLAYRRISTSWHKYFIPVDYIHMPQELSWQFWSGFLWNFRPDFARWAVEHGYWLPWWFRWILYCNYRISTFYSTGFNRFQPDSPSSNQF